jgi:hypothetical protein
LRGVACTAIGREQRRQIRDQQHGRAIGDQPQNIGADNDNANTETDRSQHVAAPAPA